MNAEYFATITKRFTKPQARGLFSFLVKLHCPKIEARNKAFFIPHVSGMCLISSASSYVITFLGITANGNLYGVRCAKIRITKL
jgi:hypothetical protein